MPIKVYTKTGDDGDTGLVGGKRVSKTHPRLNAYGTVDELNAHIGRAQSLIGAEESFNVIGAQLKKIQHQLFNLGSHLACPPEKKSILEPLPEKWVDQLEEQMDEMTKDLPALRAFILPGGSALASELHISRTVCRRAERECLPLINEGEEPSNVGFRYLNRLSDYLFVLARYCNHLQGYSDIEWEK